MKITAIVCGRKNQNTERLARVALKAAKDMGADVSLVNLMELDIRPCVNCRACTRSLVDPSFHGRCVQEKDDMRWLDEQGLSSDGLLYAAPMYECGAPGTYKLMCDRLGPSHDVTFQRDIYRRRLEAGQPPDIDTRWFKPRPAAFIGHGGSEWSYLSFPTLAIPAVCLGLTIVDYLRFDWCSRGVLLDGEKMARVAECGRHLVQMAGKAPEEMTYIGRPGVCAACHCDVIRVDAATGEALCALCGAPVRLRGHGAALEVEADAESLRISHVLESGRELHMRDLRENARLRGSSQGEIERRMRPLVQEIPSAHPGRKEAEV